MEGIGRALERPKGRRFLTELFLPLKRERWNGLAKIQPSTLTKIWQPIFDKPLIKRFARMEKTVKYKQGMKFEAHKFPKSKKRSWVVKPVEVTLGIHFTS